MTASPLGADFFGTLHAKYVSSRRGEAARKRAEAAWDHEFPILQNVVPQFATAIAPRHKIIEPLGVGGVGIVLKVFDTNLEAFRALKFARPTIGRESFFAEIITSEISRLREAVHTNIIEIYEQGSLRIEDTQYPYYIMEYIPDGRDAAEYFADSSRTADDLLAVLSQVLAGLAHLHKIQVIHGDVKLENILVAKDRRAVISDLGSARNIAQGPPDTFLVFTRPYAHPTLIALATSASDSDSNRLRAHVPRNNLQLSFDLYALGKNLLRILKFYEAPDLFRLEPYTRKYLKLMACRSLDGRNSDEECALGLPRIAFEEIKYKNMSETVTDLRKLTGDYPLTAIIPELDAHAVRTIQTSSLSPTPFTERLGRIISHPTMRRLASVPQLGFISLVYPTATHSRFEHVLGTFTNVVRYCDALYNDPINPLFRQLMTADDMNALLLAALCHDLGQYPLAHDLEEAAPDIFKHEDIAIGLLEGTLGGDDAKSLRSLIHEKWHVAPECVAAIIRADPTDLNAPIKDRILHTIISGPIDADKLDYLVRDSSNLNVPFGQAIDFERLLQCLTVIFKAQERKVYVALGIHEKGKVPAETVAFARYAMFGTIYWHHTSRAAKAMLHRAVWEGLPPRSQRTAVKTYKEQLFEFALRTREKTGVQKELFASDQQPVPLLSQVLPPDREMMEWLADRTSPTGRRLLEMLAGRDLFRRILVVSKLKSGRLWDMLSRFRDRFGPDMLVELQKEVQRRTIEFLRNAEQSEMPYPQSSAVGAEAIDRVVKAHEDGSILILIDIPNRRPGSRIPLEYLPEADRREMLQEWTQPSALEDSVI